MRYEESEKRVISSFLCIVNDSIVFIALHVGLIVLVIYTIIGEKMMKRDNGSVKRGNKSWNYFYIAYAILSVIVTQIISIPEFAGIENGVTH